MTNFLIIGNGAFCKTSVQELAPNKRIIALDGAANKLRSLDIKPDIILGDLDSISTHKLKFYQENNVEIIPKLNQNYSDLEKSIYFCDQLKSKSTTLTCVLGGRRTDHTLMAFSCLKNYYDPSRSLNIVCHDVVEFVKNQEVKYHAKIGQKFSIFGFPQAIVSSDGLKWELENLKCELGQNNSCCNEYAQEVVTLKIKGEALVVFPFTLSLYKELGNNS